MKALVLYLPVLHRGYLNFFDKHKNANLYILGKDMLETFPRIERDIRSLDPDQMKSAVESLNIFKSVEVLNKDTEIKEDSIVMPDEDLSHHVADNYFSGKDVSFESAFLRWDRMSAVKEAKVSPDTEISKEEFDMDVMKNAFTEAEKSSDWWRQVGAIIVKDGKPILIGHNRHVPGESEPYDMGDPRSNFDAGEHIEVSTALHAEAGLIAEAAKRGISLEGSSIYVTTFPCPNCAKSIAYSGIKKVYFTDGYSLVDAESILKDKGIEIIKVEKNTP